MNNIEPLSWSRIGFSTSPPVSLNLLHEPDPTWTVIVWDDRESRRQLIRHEVEDCELEPFWVQDLSALDQVRFSRCCSVAVVALGGCPVPGDRSLEMIRSLKEKGFTIICYEDRAQSWSLSARCRTLLAGASWILDSAEQEFPEKLRDLLGQSAQAEVVRRTEEDGIKKTMQKLGMVGDSQAMLSVFRQVSSISALSDLPTLITGETGTGKELVAHAIHQLDSKRRHGPFVAVNCGSISAGLAESELFGHRRGAFTGADRERKGLIRAADGGVLFLDEIGDLDAALQVKLLRVLQSRHVLGVGEDAEVAVSVRIIAATNRDLEKMVQQQQFRADLFHRLHVLSIHLPPLRERPTDLQPLVEYFVQKNRSLRPSDTLTVSPTFVEALRQLELPGNVRQLENLVQSALVNKHDNAPLDLQHFPSEVWRQLAEQSEHRTESAAQNQGQEIAQPSEPPPPKETPLHTLSSHLVKLLTAEGWSLEEALRYCERLLLEAALQLNNGNQSQTARLLGVTPRSVYSMLRRHQLAS